MKICNGCKQKYSLKDFGINKYRCKGCLRIRDRAQYKRAYKRNPNMFLDRTKVYTKKRTKVFNEYKATLKCENCPESRSWCLAFHHIDPKLKSYEISMKAQFYSLKTLMKEIAKCKVLCHNCHADLHYQNRLVS